jgi:hypothetical protein
MTAFYKPGGWRDRKPRIQFWNERGTYDHRVGELRDGDDDFSLERMHASVRFLTTNSAFKQCSLLKGIQPEPIHPEEPNLGWVWSLPENIRRWWTRFWYRLTGGGANEETYSVWERGLNGSEKIMLLGWVNKEHDLLLANQRPGAPRPNTIIVPFRAWILDPLQNPQ